MFNKELFVYYVTSFSMYLWFKGLWDQILFCYKQLAIILINIICNNESVHGDINVIMWTQINCSNGSILN